VADDGSLTYHGITLYGTIDMGLAYQSHGTPLNGSAGLGLEYLAFSVIGYQGTTAGMGDTENAATGSCSEPLLSSTAGKMASGTRPALALPTPKR
jgi:hypothetical protein